MDPIRLTPFEFGRFSKNISLGILIFPLTLLKLDLADLSLDFLDILSDLFRP